MKTYRIYTRTRKEYNAKGVLKEKTFIMSGRNIEEVKKKFKTEYGFLYTIQRVKKLY